MNLLESALLYAKNGLSVTATDESKTSIYAWKKYQEKIPTEQQISEMFSNPRAKGIAIICGAVSGNLEVIDIDCKYGVNFNDYMDKLLDYSPDLFAKLHIIRTRSNGYHIYYKCETIEGNQKLAERPATKSEKYENPNAKQFVLIETRGEKGYVVAPPSDGYTPIDINPIPVISIEERDILMSIARSFNEIIEPVSNDNRPRSDKSGSVFDDYNKNGDVIGLLKKHGWDVVKEDETKYYLIRPGQTTSATSGVLFKDNRIFYPHTTSTSFKNKGYNPFAVYSHLECGDNWQRAADELSEDYGEKPEPNLYWDYSRNGSVIISRYKLQDHLYNNHNIHLYFHDQTTGIYRLVRSKNKIISEVYPETIKKLIKTELEALQQFDVIESIIKNASAIFSDSFFEFINEQKVNILKDTKDSAFFPFKDHIVEVTQHEIKCINYSDIDGYIWSNQINDFNLKLNISIDPELCMFYRFIKCICNNEPERIDYAMSIIGYILHSYKDPTKPYAVILAEETDDEAKGGGTGKGIFFQAISKLIPVVRIDGKNFKIDKTFAFQRVGLGTKLVVIEDCPKNVDFEKYYPTITEGMTIEKKNRDELFLKYDESPKIAFTTNYSIAGNAEHAKRRQRVLEFSPFFSSTNTPLDHFGVQLFDGWDNDEWQRFYNFMFLCVRQYMSSGIKSIDNSVKLKRKQVKMQFGEDFLDYLDTVIENNNGKEMSISEEWKGFLNRSEIDKKDYSLKRFKKGLEVGSKIMGYEFSERRDSQNGYQKLFKISVEAQNDGGTSQMDEFYF